MPSVCSKVRPERVKRSLVQNVLNLTRPGLLAMADEMAQEEELEIDRIDMDIRGLVINGRYGTVRIAMDDIVHWFYETEDWKGLRQMLRDKLRLAGGYRADYAPANFHSEMD